MLNFIKNMTLMQWVFGLGVLVNIELGIAHGGVSLTNMFPDAWIPHIIAWANGLGWVGGIIMTSLAGIGIIPKQPAPAVVKVLAWLIVPMLLVLMLAHPAMAQTHKLTGNPINDIKSAIGGQPQGSSEGGGSAGGASQDQLAAALAKPFQAIADYINSDVAAAQTLSTEIPGLQDGHGQQCWMAMGQFTAVIKAHPIPLTLHAATDLEAFRLANMAANNLCANVHCTQVFSDLSNAVQQVAGQIGGAVVTNGLQIPSLNTLCSKVPQIPVIAPVAAPASITTPAPAATPSANPTGQ